MKKSVETDTVIMLINSIKQYIYLCHSSIEAVQTTENLSVEGISGLQSAKLSILHINRITNMFEYLITNEESYGDICRESFDLHAMTEELVNSLNSKLIEYLPATLHYYTKIKHSQPILIDKTKFELLIFNILYCCIKNNVAEDSASVKITLYTTEDKNNFVFHIRDNGIPIEKELIKLVFENIHTFCRNIFVPSTAEGMGLAIAQKSALEMGGHIEYARLKSGNRFDVYVPKTSSRQKPAAKSLSVYRMNVSLARETFSDLLLENITEEN